MAYYPAASGYPYTNSTPYHINNPGGDPYADVPPYQGNYPGEVPYADAPPHQGSLHPARQDEHLIQKSQTETHSSTQESVAVARKSKLAALCRGIGRQITCKNIVRFLFIVFWLACASVIVWIVVMGINHNI